MTTAMQPYRKLSTVYDRMGADRHSLKMTEYCRQIFRRFEIHPESGLDLCCGTGTALQVFADWGISMSGLDRSAPMLAVAARKLSGRRIKLYQKSLPRFRILRTDKSNQTGRFDLVTCFYDSLNYLKNGRELQAAFRTVYRHLSPGGWFIFDMNTPAALKILWGGQVYADARDDLAWVWKNYYSEKTRSAECHATCFVKTGRTWERFDEVHTERAHDNEKIISFLERAGFEVSGFYRCHTFRKPTRNSYRICGVCRRPD